MKTFEIDLSRVYKIKIDAEDENSAKQLTEFFIGNPKDESNDKDRKKYNFHIRNIEMMLNEAADAEKL